MTEWLIHWVQVLTAMISVCPVINWFLGRHIIQHRSIGDDNNDDVLGFGTMCPETLKMKTVRFSGT